MSVSAALRADPVPLTYTATANCQYMENHRPVQPFGAQSAMAVAMSNEGQPFLFSFDSAGLFQATVASDGPGPGWTSYPIGVSGYEPGQASPALFGVNQSQDGTIAALLVMTVNPDANGNFVDGSYHEVWLQYGLDNAPNASWLSSPDQSWTKLAFPSNPSVAVSASSLQVTNLSVLQLATDGTAATALAHVKNQDGDLISFYVDLTGGDDPWTLLPPEHSYTSLLGAVSGALDTSNAVGIFKLYQYGDAPLLTFMSSQDGVTTFTVSSAASAIASLPGVYEIYSVTDLFVSDGPNINLFLSSGLVSAAPTPGSPTDPITITSASWLSGCTNLQAAVDLSDPDNAVVSLWGITGSQAAFHIQAPYAQRADPTAWSQPVPLLANVNASAIHISTTRGLTTMFANQGAAGDTALVELHKDHLTMGGANHWRKRSVHVLPAPNSPPQYCYQTLQTYTHRFQILDQNGLPPPLVTQNGVTVGALVNITSSATVVLEINSQITTLTAAQGVQVNLNPQGIIDIMQEANTPQQPTLTVSLVSGPSALPGADSGGAISVEPAYNVRQSIGTQLAAAVSTQQTNPSYQPFPWFNPQNGATLANVSAQVTKSNGIQLNPPANSNTPQAVHLGSLASDFAFIGDICQAIAEDLETVALASVQFAEGVWQLSVSFAEGAFTAIIQTVEDIAGAIVSLVSWIGAGLEDIWNWLAFLFDWGNIFVIQGQIYYLYNQLFTVASNGIAEALTALGQWVSYYGQQMADGTPGFQPAQQVPAQSVQASSQQNASTQQSNTSSNSPGATDPRMSWGQNQLPPPSTSGASASRADKAAAPTSDGFTASSDPLDAAIAQFVTDFGTLAETTVDDLAQVVSGDMSLSEAATLIQNSIGNLVGELGTVFGLMSAEAGAPIGALQTLLTTTPDIPLFPSIYAVLAPAGSPPFNWLSLFCLLQAVPATFAYGIITGGNGQAANFLPSAVVDQACDALTTYFNTLPSPPIGTLIPSQTSSAQMTLSARRERSLSDDTGIAAAMRYMLGLAHMFRGVSTYVMFPTELAYMQANTNDTSIAYRNALLVDGQIWASEGLLGLVISILDGEEVMTDLANVVGGAYVAIRAFLLPYGYDSFGVLAQTGAIMGAISVVTGLFEVISGAETLLAEGDSSEMVGGGVDLIYGANEVLELYVAFAVHGVHNNPDCIPTVTTANSLRCVMMLAASLGEFIVLGLEN